MGRKTMKLNKVFRIFTVFMAIPMLMAAKPARADDAAVAIFISSVAIAQSEAIRAQANYYEAIGYGQKAQGLLKLADGYKNGSFGGNESVDTFVSTSAMVADDINQLVVLGAPLDNMQRQKAKKAKQQLTVAKIAFVAALASGVTMVLQSKGNFLEKLALGAAVGVTVAKLSGSMKQVNRAANAFGTLSVGRGGGFQLVSKELAPGFVEL